MEVLSEHLCEGWLEGYLLTGRHGLFNCYEAFIHIVDSMFNQHAKWLKVTREHRLAAAHRLAELPAVSAGLAAGPQRVLAPGSGVHRPRGEQEGRDRPRLPAAGRQLPAVGGRPLPAQPALRQRHRGRQAAGAELAHHGRGGDPLHPRGRHLGMGQQRPARRARRRHGLLRRRPDPRDPGRGRSAPPAPAGTQGAGGQRGRPDAAAAGDRAPARHVRRRVRLVVHHRPSGDLRLPRLPVAHPPAHLPPHEPRQLPRARIQRGRHHHHPVRHGHAQRSRPVPPGHGRDRPGAGTDVSAGHVRQDMDDQRIKARAYTRQMERIRRRSATGPGRTKHAYPGSRGQRRLQQPQAAGPRRFGPGDRQRRPAGTARRDGRRIHGRRAHLVR